MRYSGQKRWAPTEEDIVKLREKYSKGVTEEIMREFEEELKTNSLSSPWRKNEVISTCKRSSELLS